MGILRTMTRIFQKSTPSDNQTTVENGTNQAKRAHEHSNETGWTIVGNKGSHVVASGQHQEEHYVVEDASHSQPKQAFATELKQLNDTVAQLSQRNAFLEQAARNTTNEHKELVLQKELHQNRSTELDNRNKALERRLKETEIQLQKTQSKWDCAVNLLFDPYIKERSLKPNPTNSPLTVEFVARCIYKDVLELAPLRERHQRLQQEMLANVERTQSISDEEIDRQYRTLASTIKGLSRSIPAEGLEKIGAAFGKFVLLQGVHGHYWNTRPRRKLQIEAVVWSILVENVFQNPFLAFGRTDPVLKNLPYVWYGMFGSDHHYNWPIPSDSSEKWRYTTVDHLIQSTGRAIFTRGDPGNAVDKERNGLQASVYDAQCILFQQLREVFQHMVSDFDCERLNSVIQTAFTLAVDMFSQRCRFQVMWPQLDEEYSLGVTTGLVSIPDSEEVPEGRVAFIVNPGLTKWGDAHGKCLDQRLDIVPALVFVEESVQETSNIGPAEGGKIEDGGSMKMLDDKGLD